ncbi:unnamed protein product, partial [Discosporangium mesarthrocarpum]
LSPDNVVLLASTTDNTLSIRRRDPRETREGVGVGEGGETDRSTPRGGTLRYFNRGKGEVAGADAVQVTMAKKKSLAQHDQALRRFDYRGALDKALDTRDPLVVTGLLEVLGERGGIRAALSNRTSESLLPIANFLHK